MLSDKEKKAFESVKDMFSDVTIKDIDEQSITIYGVAMLDVIKVLTIVEKQSKEIEELKEDNKKKSIVIIEYQDLYEKLEDKIKAKIEEVSNGTYDAKIVLQSLLEKEFPVTITKEELEKRWKE